MSKNFNFLEYYQIFNAYTWCMTISMLPLVCLLLKCMTLGSFLIQYDNILPTQYANNVDALGTLRYSGKFLKCINSLCMQTKHNINIKFSNKNIEFYFKNVPIDE